MVRSWQLNHSVSSQRCHNSANDTSDTFWSDSIVCSDSSITSIIAVLTLTLGVNGPLLLVERSACNAFCIHPKRSVNFIRRKWIRYAIYVLHCELQFPVNDNSLLPWFTILTADSLLSTATLFGKNIKFCECCCGSKNEQNRSNIRGSPEQQYVSTTAVQIIQSYGLFT